MTCISWHNKFIERKSNLQKCRLATGIILCNMTPSGVYICDHPQTFCGLKPPITCVIERWWITNVPTRQLDIIYYIIYQQLLMQLSRKTGTMQGNDMTKYMISRFLSVRFALAQPVRTKVAIVNSDASHSCCFKQIFLFLLNIDVSTDDLSSIRGVFHSCNDTQEMVIYMGCHKRVSELWTE